MKNHAFYRASATTLFFPDFKKYEQIEIVSVVKLCLINTKQPLVFYLM